eukprot:CAMPEP_0194231110 /NCGR_PEP_ID=MMETSP0156-20130528/44759_1 /TAXON_ID=33649 /ORGANISM="Thalassionema nitzschioides, Strain L26-B" /LENGTH=280 /DNA_ID=CAMNT_0038963721 /DNA_START=21 /DNA_END=863 /DNA_ORIENTATION=-
MVFLPCNIDGIIGYTVEMTIVRARNLIAKDRHLLTRQRTTSDPYVEVFLGIDQRIGKTKTIKKTCNPEWSATFIFDVNTTKVSDELVAGVIFLKLYDEDLLTDPDLLGTMVIPIPTTENEVMESKWYPVDNVFCPRATGEVEIKFQLTPIMGSVCFPRRGCWSSLMPSPETVARWVVIGKNSIMPNNKTNKDDDRNAIHENDIATRRDYIVALIQAIYVNNEQAKETAPRREKHSRDSNLFSEPIEGKVQQDTNQLEDWLMKVIRARGGNEKTLSFLFKS